MQYSSGQAPDDAVLPEVKLLGHFTGAIGIVFTSRHQFIGIIFRHLHSQVEDIFQWILIDQMLQRYTKQFFHFAGVKRYLLRIVNKAHKGVNDGIKRTGNDVQGGN